MRNEELDTNGLDPELAAVAARLEQTILHASIPNRDRLMFLCGQAAGSQPLRSTDHQRGAGRILLSATIAALAFVAGGLAVQWIPDAFVARQGPPLADGPVAPAADRRSDHTEMSPQGDREVDFEGMIKARSGQLVVAALDPSQVDSFRSSSRATAGTLTESSILNVGMTNRWFREQSD